VTVHDAPVVLATTMTMPLMSCRTATEAPSRIVALCSGFSMNFTIWVNIIRSTSADSFALAACDLFAY
jgi:hypothetical protein